MYDQAGHSFETMLATTLTPVAERHGFRAAISRLLGGAALLGCLLATPRASAAWHKHHHKHAKHHASAQKKDANPDKDQSARKNDDQGDQSTDKAGQNDDNDTSASDESASKPPADDTGTSSTHEQTGEKALEFKVRWSGLETDFRAALASASGGLASKTSVDSGLVLPLWVDIGYRIDKRWFAGIFGQVGLSLQARKCVLGTSCHPMDYRFGAEGQFHILPAHALDPWVGLGFGYELYDIQGAVARGFELANVQAGLLFRTSRRSGLGPFVAFTTGQFSHFGGIPISDQTLHEWFMIGLHGSYWQPLYN